MAKKDNVVKAAAVKTATAGKKAGDTGKSKAGASKSNAAKSNAVKPRAAKTSKTGRIDEAARASKVAKTSKTSEKKVSRKQASEKKAGKDKAGKTPERAQVLTSKVVYNGPLFRVHHDTLIEPDGLHSERDVIRHNGSVVILAVDSSSSKKSTSKKDPWVVVERQYRHAANQYLWELPAGKLEPGEDPLAGAQRELAEETGYRAKNWKLLVEYFASPGFLGESMKIFLAEGLVAGEARPEEDEKIEFRLVKLSEVLKMIDKGAILDGKTLTGILFYARKTGAKGKK